MQCPEQHCASSFMQKAPFPPHAEAVQRPSAPHVPLQQSALLSHTNPPGKHSQRPAGLQAPRQHGRLFGSGLHASPSAAHTHVPPEHDPEQQ
jgi:hypothetical protein